MADCGVSFQGHSHSQVDGAGQTDVDQRQQPRDQLLEGLGQVHPGHRADSCNNYKIIIDEISTNTQELKIEIPVSGEI